jgi:hypothetical protein
VKRKVRNNIQRGQARSDMESAEGQRGKRPLANPPRGRPDDQPGRVTSKLAMHHERVNKPQRRMPECSRQPAHDLESEPLP